MIQQEKSPSEAKTQERQIEITRGPDFKTSRKVLNLKLKSSISPMKIMNAIIWEVKPRNGKWHIQTYRRHFALLWRRSCWFSRADFASTCLAFCSWLRRLCALDVLAQTVQESQFQPLLVYAHFISEVDEVAGFLSLFLAWHRKRPAWTWACACAWVFVHPKISFIKNRDDVVISTLAVRGNNYLCALGPITTYPCYNL